MWDNLAGMRTLHPIPSPHPSPSLHSSPPPTLPPNLSEWAAVFWRLTGCLGSRASEGEHGGVVNKWGRRGSGKRIDRLKLKVGLKRWKRRKAEKGGKQWCTKMWKVSLISLATGALFWNAMQPRKPHKTHTLPCLSLPMKRIRLRGQGIIFMLKGFITWNQKHFIVIKERLREVGGLS